jgi:hypothetical protein
MLHRQIPELRLSGWTLLSLLRALPIRQVGRIDSTGLTGVDIWS